MPDVKGSQQNVSSSQDSVNPAVDSRKTELGGSSLPSGNEAERVDARIKKQQGEIIHKDISGVLSNSSVNIASIRREQALQQRLSQTNGTGIDQNTPSIASSEELTSAGTVTPSQDDNFLIHLFENILKKKKTRGISQRSFQGIPKMMDIITQSLEEIQTDLNKKENAGQGLSANLSDELNALRSLLTSSKGDLVALLNISQDTGAGENQEDKQQLDEFKENLLKSLRMALPEIEKIDDEKEREKRIQAIIMLEVVFTLRNQDLSFNQLILGLSSENEKIKKQSLEMLRDFSFEATEEERTLLRESGILDKLPKDGATAGYLRKWILKENSDEAKNIANQKQSELQAQEHFKSELKEKYGIDINEFRSLSISDPKYNDTLMKLEEFSIIATNEQRILLRQVGIREIVLKDSLGINNQYSTSSYLLKWIDCLNEFDVMNVQKNYLSESLAHVVSLQKGGNDFNGLIQAEIKRYESFIDIFSSTHSYGNKFLRKVILENIFLNAEVSYRKIYKKYCDIKNFKLESIDESELIRITNLATNSNKFLDDAFTDKKNLNLITTVREDLQELAESTIKAKGNEEKMQARTDFLEKFYSCSEEEKLAFLETKNSDGLLPAEYLDTDTLAKIYMHMTDFYAKELASLHRDSLIRRMQGVYDFHMEYCEGRINNSLSRFKNAFLNVIPTITIENDIKLNHDKILSESEDLRNALQKYGEKPRPVSDINICLSYFYISDQSTSKQILDIVNQNKDARIVFSGTLHSFDDIKVLIDNKRTTLGQRAEALISKGNNIELNDFLSFLEEFRNAEDKRQDFLQSECGKNFIKFLQENNLNAFMRALDKPEYCNDILDNFAQSHYANLETLLAKPMGDFSYRHSYSKETISDFDQVISHLDCLEESTGVDGSILRNRGGIPREFFLESYRFIHSDNCQNLDEILRLEKLELKYKNLIGITLWNENGEFLKDDYRAQVNFASQFLQMSDDDKKEFIDFYKKVYPAFEGALKELMDNPNEEGLRSFISKLQYGRGSSFTKEQQEVLLYYFKLLNSQNSNDENNKITDIIFAAVTISNADDISILCFNRIGKSFVDLQKIGQPIDQEELVRLKVLFDRKDLNPTLCATNLGRVVKSENIENTVQDIKDEFNEGSEEGRVIKNVELLRSLIEQGGYNIIELDDGNVLCVNANPENIKVKKNEEGSYSISINGGDDIVVSPDYVFLKSDFNVLKETLQREEKIVSSFQQRCQQYLATGKTDAFNRECSLYTLTATAHQLSIFYPTNEYNYMYVDSAVIDLHDKLSKETDIKFLEDVIFNGAYGNFEGIDKFFKSQYGLSIFEYCQKLSENGTISKTTFDYFKAIYDGDEKRAYAIKLYEGFEKKDFSGLTLDSQATREEIREEFIKYSKERKTEQSISLDSYSPDQNGYNNVLSYYGENKSDPCTELSSIFSEELLVSSMQPSSEESLSNLDELMTKLNQLIDKPENDGNTSEKVKNIERLKNIQTIVSLLQKGESRTPEESIKLQQAVILELNYLASERANVAPYLDSEDGILGDHILRIDEKASRLILLCRKEDTGLYNAYIEASKEAFQVVALREARLYGQGEERTRHNEDSSLPSRFYPEYLNYSDEKKDLRWETLNKISSVGGVFESFSTQQVISRGRIIGQEEIENAPTQLLKVAELLGCQDEQFGCTPFKIASNLHSLIDAISDANGGDVSIDKNGNVIKMTNENARNLLHDTLIELGRCPDYIQVLVKESFKDYSSGKTISIPTYIGEKFGNQSWWNTFKTSLGNIEAFNAQLNSSEMVATQYFLNVDDKIFGEALGRLALIEGIIKNEGADFERLTNELEEINASIPPEEYVNRKLGEMGKTQEFQNKANDINGALSELQKFLSPEEISTIMQGGKLDDISRLTPQQKDSIRSQLEKYNDASASLNEIMDSITTEYRKELLATIKISYERLYGKKLEDIYDDLKQNNTTMCQKGVIKSLLEGNIKKSQVYKIRLLGEENPRGEDFVKGLEEFIYDIDPLTGRRTVLNPDKIKEFRSLWKECFPNEPLENIKNFSFLQDWTETVSNGQGTYTITHNRENLRNWVGSLLNSPSNDPYGATAQAYAIKHYTENGNKNGITLVLASCFEGKDEAERGAKQALLENIIGKNLHDYINKDLSLFGDPEKNALSSLVNDGEVSDAIKIHMALFCRWRAEPEKVMAILKDKNEEEIKKIKEDYKNLTGNTLESAFEAKLQGYVKFDAVWVLKPPQTREEKMQYMEERYKLESSGLLSLGGKKELSEKFKKAKDATDKNFEEAYKEFIAQADQYREAKESTTAFVTGTVSFVVVGGVTLICFASGVGAPVGFAIVAGTSLATTVGTNEAINGEGYDVLSSRGAVDIASSLADGACFVVPLKSAKIATKIFSGNRLLPIMMRSGVEFGAWSASSELFPALVKENYYRFDSQKNVEFLKETFKDSAKAGIDGFALGAGTAGTFYVGGKVIKITQIAVSKTVEGGIKATNFIGKTVGKAAVEYVPGVKLTFNAGRKVISSSRQLADSIKKNATSFLRRAISKSLTPESLGGLEQVGEKGIRKLYTISEHSASKNGKKILEEITKRGYATPSEIRSLRLFHGCENLGRGSGKLNWLKIVDGSGNLKVFPITRDFTLRTAQDVRFLGEKSLEKLQLSGRNVGNVWKTKNPLGQEQFSELAKRGSITYSEAEALGVKEFAHAAGKNPYLIIRGPQGSSIIPIVKDSIIHTPVSPQILDRKEEDKEEKKSKEEEKEQENIEDIAPITIPLPNDLENILKEDEEDDVGMKQDSTIENKEAVDAERKQNNNNSDENLPNEDTRDVQEVGVKELQKRDEKFNGILAKVVGSEILNGFVDKEELKARFYSGKIGTTDESMESRVIQEVLLGNVKEAEQLVGEMRSQEVRVETLQKRDEEFNGILDQVKNSEVLKEYVKEEELRARFYSGEIGTTDESMESRVIQEVLEGNVERAERLVLEIRSQEVRVKDLRARDERFKGILDQVKNSKILNGFVDEEELRARFYSGEIGTTDESMESRVVQEVLLGNVKEAEQLVLEMRSQEARVEALQKRDEEFNKILAKVNGSDILKGNVNEEELKVRFYSDKIGATDESIESRVIQEALLGNVERAEQLVLEMQSQEARVKELQARDEKFNGILDQVKNFEVLNGFVDKEELEARFYSGEIGATDESIESRVIQEVLLGNVKEAEQLVLEMQSQEARVEALQKRDEEFNGILAKVRNSNILNDFVDKEELKVRFYSDKIGATDESIESRVIQEVLLGNIKEAEQLVLEMRSQEARVEALQKRDEEFNGILAKVRNSELLNGFVKEEELRSVFYLTNGNKSDNEVTLKILESKIGDAEELVMKQRANEIVEKEGEKASDKLISLNELGKLVDRLPEEKNEAVKAYLNEKREEIEVQVVREESIPAIMDKKDDNGNAISDFEKLRLLDELRKSLPNNIKQLVNETIEKQENILRQRIRESIKKTVYYQNALTFIENIQRYADNPQEMKNKILEKVLDLQEKAKEVKDSIEKNIFISEIKVIITYWLKYKKNLKNIPLREKELFNFNSNNVNNVLLKNDEKSLIFDNKYQENQPARENTERSFSSLIKNNKDIQASNKEGIKFEKLAGNVKTSFDFFQTQNDYEIIDNKNNLNRKINILNEKDNHKSNLNDSESLSNGHESYNNKENIMTKDKNEILNHNDNNFFTVKESGLYQTIDDADSLIKEEVLDNRKVDKKQESKKNDIKEESSTNNNTHKENYNINSDENIFINKNEELSKDKTDISNSKVSNNNIKNVEEKFYNGLIDEISEESFDLTKLKTVDNENSMNKKTAIEKQEDLLKQIFAKNKEQIQNESNQMIQDNDGIVNKNIESEVKNNKNDFDFLTDDFLFNANDESNDISDKNILFESNIEKIELMFESINIENDFLKMEDLKAVNSGKKKHNYDGKLLLRSIQETVLLLIMFRKFNLNYDAILKEELGGERINPMLEDNRRIFNQILRSRIMQIKRFKKKATMKDLLKMRVYNTQRFLMLLLLQVLTCNRANYGKRKEELERFLMSLSPEIRKIIKVDNVFKNLIKSIGRERLQKIIDIKRLYDVKPLVLTEEVPLKESISS